MNADPLSIIAAMPEDASAAYTMPSHVHDSVWHYHPECVDWEFVRRLHHGMGMENLRWQSAAEPLAQGVRDYLHNYEVGEQSATCDECDKSLRFDIPGGHPP